MDDLAVPPIFGNLYLGCEKNILKIKYDQIYGNEI